LALSESGLDARLVLHVHDEILLEASEQDAEQAKVILQAAMLRGFQTVFPNASTLDSVEAHIGRTWADAK
jgi:DNA polymerase-1